MSRKHLVQADAAAFLAGEAAAVERIHRVMRRLVQCFRLPSSDLREEIVQESMSRLLLAIRAGRFRGESSLAIYAQAVARYTCLEFLRSRSVSPEVSFDSPPERSISAGPEEQLVRREDHFRRLQVLEELPPDTMELLRLVFVEGLSYKEVGNRCGMSVGAVKTRIHRSRLQLKKSIRT